MANRSHIESHINHFLQEKQPIIVGKAPARINLINPLDAVEADYWAPAMAISSHEDPLSAYCYIKPSNQYHSKIIIYRCSDDCTSINIEELYETSISYLTRNHQENYNSNLFIGTLEYLFTKIPEFSEVLFNQELEIGILTTIPRQSGIAGSSALIISLIWTIGAYCAFDKKNPRYFSSIPFNRDVLGELSTEIENLVIKNTAGYGDRYTIARGGIGFASYIGKLLHPPLGTGPLVVYDRIDQTYDITDIPIILAFSGVLHTSGDIHFKLRKMYLDGDSVLIQCYKELSEVAWKSRYALMKHDWKELGIYFEENSKISEKIMKHAGFEFGIGWANKILINLIKNEKDVYSVKLSGAGGGGSVFALVNPEKKEDIINLWQEKLHHYIANSSTLNETNNSISKSEIKKLRNAKFFTIQLSNEGVHTYNYNL